MITQDDIAVAAERISGRVRVTPSLWVEAGTLGPEPVILKLEQVQHTGSFKVRGAFNAIGAADVPSAGVVAVSGGNHGAAVGYAATALGHKSVVFAPDFAGPVKIARMRHFGAQVVVGGDDVGELLEQFTAYAKETGALAVHPYDDPSVMAGQGTLAREFEAQAGGLHTIIVSVGGGGLVGGMAGWFGPNARIVAVESEGTATLAKTYRDGPGASVRASGLAASALGASTIGDGPWAQLQDCDVHSVLVTDAEIHAAQTLLWEQLRLVVEPGAATAVAALTSGRYSPAIGERVGVVVCGANAAPDWFAD